MKAIILAAGEGKRLRPITGIVCKPLLPVGGRPIIEQLVENIREVGIGEISIVIGHLGEQIIDFLGDGSKYGVRLAYQEQRRKDGTAQALQLAADLVDRDVLVTAGDTAFSAEHLRTVIGYFYEQDCDLTLSLKRLDREKILAASTVKLEADNTISAIVEKPAPNQILSAIAAAPIYVAKRAIFDYLPRVKRSERGEYEIASAIQLMIDDGLRVKGIFGGVAPDLTNLVDLLKLNFEYISRILPSQSPPDMETRKTSPSSPKEE